MDHDYVTLKTAQLLYDVGYPQEEGDYYEIRIGLCGKEYISKPTIAQAIKYLDSVGIIILPDFISDETWSFSVLKSKNSQVIEIYKGLLFYPTRESALENGIIKVCKLLEDKV